MLYNLLDLACRAIFCTTAAQRGNLSTTYAFAWLPMIQVPSGSRLRLHLPLGRWSSSVAPTTEDHRFTQFVEVAMARCRTDPILPDLRTVIDPVFCELIRSRQLDRSSDEAEMLAARLLNLYQNGIRESDNLRQMAEFLWPRGTTF